MKIKYNFWKLYSIIINSGKLSVDEKASALWLDRYDFIKLANRA